MIEISTQREFEAAHQLLMLPEGHKCRRLHGHNYKIEVVVRGEDVAEDGILIDYADLDGVIDDQIINVLDHRYLNDIIDNPTGENIAKWCSCKLIAAGVGVYCVSVWETDRYRATYFV